MRWRLFRLNWAYGFGELAIVVVGVIIALGVEQWNSDRLDRVEEIEIIDRLIGDLREDLDGIDFGLGAIRNKKTLLTRISLDLSSPGQRPDDLKRFLQDVVASGGYGWAQARARRTTFDEVLASGKFGLIRDTDIRGSISDYYEREAGQANRIEERETVYPNLSYQLVPRETEFQLASNLNNAQLEGLVDKVFSSPLPNYVIGELNFTQFLSEVFVAWRELCLALIEELEVYRDSIAA